ncbi:MAG TPA: VIT1/CCC1 transporter family protein [Thermoanaerobaculia bacterium]|nr:VIT1/CCC1 transporter family protein [Thermoanaerobaculia bacterium]
MTRTSAEAPGPARANPGSVLDPTERFSEILFGLIMVLTFTGSLSAATSGRQQVRTMLVGAIGCNLAWGLIDAIFYLMNTLGQRGHGAVVLRRLRQGPEPAVARALLADALPPALASVLRPEDLDLLRRRLDTLPEIPRRVPLHRDDFRGAAGVFLLVFLSTFPVALPFLFMHDAMRALRISNAIAIALLFVGGYRLAKFSGFHPWRTGLAMVAIGVALVGLTIALGG